MRRLIGLRYRVRVWRWRETTAANLERVALSYEQGHPSFHKGGAPPWDPHHAAFFLHKYRWKIFLLRKRIKARAMRVTAWALRFVARRLRVT